MVTQGQIREKLQSQLFDRYGKSVTFKKKSSPIYNDRGEELDQTFTESTITVVPYNINHKTRNQIATGDFPEGAMQVAVPYTVNLDVEDRMTIESEDWEVTAVERNYLPDNIVFIATIVRVHN